jgi:glycosyltransferase involved in cell wall biosynthesis
MSYKVKTFGWRNKTLDQLSRIDSGLENLGCSFVEESPDIVYANNDMYDDILDFANKQSIRPYIILNVLDLQLKNPSYDLKKVHNQLLQADAISCISQVVQKQIKDAFNISADVIYNPVKEISYDESIKKLIPFLYVGRANDYRKRFKLIIDTFNQYEDIQDNLIICGSENPLFGKYIGIVNDANLNMLYNTSKFLLFPSEFEGLGLPMIEAMIGGCIPVTCSDNKTALEFSPSEFICDPDPDSFLNKLIELNKDYAHFQKIAIEFGEKYKLLMSKNNVAKNILNIYQNALC